MNGLLPKIPPQSIEAEMSVLGAMLLDNATIEKVREMLSETDFYKEAHKKIYLAILGLQEKNEPVDLVSLTEELKKRSELDMVGGAGYLATILNCVPTAANVEQYAKIVKDKSILRSLINAATQIVQIGLAEGEVDLILAKSQKLFSDVLAKSGTVIEDSRPKITLETLRTHFCLRETPFKTLNKMIGGGFDRELVIIGGRAGIGKTPLVLEFLWHTAVEEQKPVIYFAVGTTLDKIYLRLLCSKCNISMTDFNRERINESQTKILMSTHKKINQAPIYITTAAKSFNVVSIPSAVRAYKRKVRELGLVIIENLQDLDWPEKTQGIKEKTDNILSMLKNLSLELNVSVIVSSQLSRQLEEREDKRPRLSDLKGSGSIEEKADKILLLHREAFYTRSKNSPEPEDGEIIIAKGGPPKTLAMKFYGDYLSWRER